MLKSLNILYVKGENFSHKNIIEALEFMSMSVKSVSNGQTAYKEYKKNKPDIIISGINIPTLNGLSLIKKIREEDKDIQIIILSKCVDVECLIKATELNLVKYLLRDDTSLIDLKEALIICNDNITKSRKSLKRFFNEKDFYDLNHRLLYVNEKVIRLDPHEREFLELLLKNEFQIVKYDEIEKEIWLNNMSSAAIRSLVRNLRKKLPPKAIENISKIGYRIIVRNI